MTIEQIKQANARAGFHFFKKATMRFFRSRVLSKVHQGDGGTYFVTSEQGPNGVRAYTVRCAMKDGSIETCGEFQGFSNSASAHRKARQAALGF